MAVDLTHNYPENRLKLKVTETVKESISRRAFINSVIDKHLIADVREQIAEMVYGVKNNILDKLGKDFSVDETFISAFRKFELNMRSKKPQEDFYAGKCTLTVTMYLFNEEKHNLETLVLDFDIQNYHIPMPDYSVNGIPVRRSLSQWLRSVSISYNPDALVDPISCQSVLQLKSDSVNQLRESFITALADLSSKLVSNSANTAEIFKVTNVEEYAILQRVSNYSRYKEVLSDSENWLSMQRVVMKN